MSRNIATYEPHGRLRLPNVAEDEMEKLLSFNTCRVLLWIGLAVFGFASRANAYICHDTDTCQYCYSYVITWISYGSHCCTNWCAEPNYPNCGTPASYEHQLGTCSGGGGCTIIEYYSLGAACSCGTCP